MTTTAGTRRRAEPKAAPRWLSAEQQVAWRTFLATTTLLTDRLDRELQAESGMPLSYYEILVRLSEAPDHRMRMSDLAVQQLSSRSRLSHAVSRLEEQGWVTRTACPTDKRGAFAELTDAGFAALKEAAPGHVESVRRHLIDRLTAQELAQLQAICKSVMEPLADVLPGGVAGCPLGA